MLKLEAKWSLQATLPTYLPTQAQFEKKDFLTENFGKRKVQKISSNLLQKNTHGA